MIFRKLYFALAKIPVKALVRINNTPSDPIETLSIDTDKPIFYVMRTRSVSSFVMLERECEKLGLPKPEYLSRSDQTIKNGGVFFIQHKTILGRRPGTIKKYSDLFTTLSKQFEDDIEQVQLLPISIFWGRDPGKENSLFRIFFTDTESANPIRKLLLLIFQGRNSFMHFGHPVQLDKLQSAGKPGIFTRKLIRLLRVYFRRRWSAAMGPLVADRKQLIDSLVANDNVRQAIEYEQKKKKISPQKAKKRARYYANEIASNYSYKTVRLLRSLLTWLWNKLYAGIQVHNADRLRTLAKTHEIVYVPCHRSHMDYLLLSYILYYESLVPPHIAAGINLNFWPIGGVLRKGGAFFIRRSFSGNKLYTAVFNAYFHTLLHRGTPVEFFPEGGRSRTGRLLEPKTGMLSMLVQNTIRGCRKPIALVPVYVGYERMMEGVSYIKEMQGAEKKKESVGQLLKVRSQLKQRYGKVFVNFAEPIIVDEELDKIDTDWRNRDANTKPEWLGDLVSSLGQNCMEKINASGIVNCVNLTALILLSTQRHTLGRNELEEQIDLYINLLQRVPYDQNTKLAYSNATEIVEESKKLSALNEFKNPLGNLCQIPENSAVLMTYYRNNVLHLFAIPSLLASCFRKRNSYKKSDLYEAIKAVYPLLKRELFLKFTNEDLLDYLDNLVEFFVNNGLLIQSGEDILRPDFDSAEYSQLMLMADGLKDTLERYAITLTLLSTHVGKSSISRLELESQSQKLAQRIAALYSIYAPEAFDKKLFQQIVGTLRRQDFIKSESGGDLSICPSVPELQQLVMSLLSQSTCESLTKTARWALKRWHEDQEK